MSDKFTPYSVTQGKPYFDWNAFLSKESYTKEELREAECLAISWVTCACGNQCAAIPRIAGGNAPADRCLNMLGERFPYFVREMSIYLERGRAKAKETLLKIEQRSAEILQEMAKKSL